METLQDVSWIRYLYTSVTLERFTYGSFRVVSVMVPESSIHHNERYKYRMLFFETATITPVLAINLESDILGPWDLTLQSGTNRDVLQRFDEAPSYETFRRIALAKAEKKATLVPRQAKRHIHNRNPGLRIPRT